MKGDWHPTRGGLFQPASSTRAAFEDIEVDLAQTAPGYRKYLVFCDETGMSGGLPYYGFGSLWIPWERRGDLAAIVGDARSRWFDQELKWTGVTRHTLPMYKHLAEQFFRRRWMMFHGLLVPRATVDPKKHHGGWQVAMRKHYTMLLANKIRRFGTGAKKLYRIRVDQLPFAYQKSHEVIEIIGNHLVEDGVGQRLIHSVIPVDSKRVLGIQLCDVLLGAIASAWQGSVGPKSAKAELARFIAGHLGWPDLGADTYSTEWKFNIWHFKERSAPRVARTRSVDLRYPVPPYRP